MRTYRIKDVSEAMDYERQLDRAYMDFDVVSAMSDTDACEACNTDTKEEALRGIEEEISFLEYELDLIAV